MQPLDREAVLARLRPAILDDFVAAERQLGCQVVFRELPPRYHFTTAAAHYSRRPREARILLRSDWQDYDLCHEVQHLRLNLVERYGQLVQRTRMPLPEDVDAASDWIQSYVSDEVVHERVRRLGLQFQGEIIHGGFFQRRVTCARLLSVGAARNDDDMDRFDHIGRGTLCRAAYYVQTVLLRERRAALFEAGALPAIDCFLHWFRLKRAEETKYGDTVLTFFGESDVQTVTGHDAILDQWANLEGLGKWVGVSRYVRRQEGGYRLPPPS